MIYIFTALYCEAEILIKHFDLKKVPECTCFQQFCNENADLRLTICGTGEIAAAAAVASVCTKYKPQKADFLLNIGICAGVQKREGIFLVHKLVEQATGKTFYPDLLYRHDFEEESLMTGRRPWMREETVTCEVNHYEMDRCGMNDSKKKDCRMNDRKKNDCGMNRCGMNDCKINDCEINDCEMNDCEASLYDMEASAIYQSGSYFLGPHQMVFLKIVSDNGDIFHIDLKQHTRKLMAEHRDKICGFIMQLSDVSGVLRQREEEISQMEEQNETWIRQLCADMHCSMSMEHSVRQQIRYLALAGMDGKAAVQEMYTQGRLPCRDKREGKQCFEEFKNRLF